MVLKETLCDVAATKNSLVEKVYLSHNKTPLPLIDSVIFQYTVLLLLKFYLLVSQVLNKGINWIHQYI
jgi:hypothetical protein